MTARGEHTYTGHSVVALRMYEAREALILMGHGALVGILAGLAAVVLHLAVAWVESIRHALEHSLWIILLPAVGAFLGMVCQYHLFRDRSAHGVPDVIRAVTIGRGILPRRMMFSRLISSCLTVGTGGAAGLEGPIVASGGALGSFISTIFKVPQRRRVLLIACGTSGAIAGVFNAPLTGMIFSLEVILGEWKSRNLVPTVTSAAIAAQVSRSLMGDKIPFPREEILHSFPDLPAFALLGVICAYTGRLLFLTLDRSTHLFEKTPLSPELRAGLGGLMVGVVAYFFPAAMGEGYKSIQLYISGAFSGPLFAVAGLFFLRLLTTGFTLGSGGSGGIFAPSLSAGAAVGLLFGNGLHLLPPVIPFADPAAYALVGMAGLVAGIMSAPLTGMFLILEICGSYDLILPLMLTTLVSTTVTRYLQEGSIYTRELISSGQFKRRGTGAQLLAGVDISEVLSSCPKVNHAETLGQFIQKFGSDPRDIYALMDDDDICQGLIFLEDVRPYMFDETLYPIITMASIADNTMPPLREDATPDLAWTAFANTSRPALPVLDSEHHLLGIITKNSLFDHARTELSVHDES